jgi:hypothetical protein
MMRRLLIVLALASLSLAVLTVAECQNVRNPPAKALLLISERQQWQALAQVCAVPAFCNRGGATPLVLCDGTGKLEVAIPHDTVKVSSLGANATAASAALARRYWKKAPTVFVVDNYEQALWIVPSAAFLQAPILVSPDAGLLKSLGTTKAVVVGRARPRVAEVANLDDKVAVWKYQLALMGNTPRACNYIVMTNPHDTDDNLNPNVQWPFLSVAAAPLAAYHRALVQTGDYTGDRTLIHALGVSLGDAGDKVKYATLKPTFQKVKDDSLVAERFLFGAGKAPEYLAMVGGSVELPHYVIDLHTKYTYWNQAIDYVPADTPYATMRDDVDYTRFVQPDLAVGRLMGDTLEDVTLQLQKTFFYKEYLPGGKYAALAPEGWEKAGIVYDGHRLNQPDEGGPEASPSEPFHPAGEVAGVYRQSGLDTSYVYPCNETDKADQRPKAPELLGMTGDYGFVQYVAHGDPPFMRVETGMSGRDRHNYLVTGAEWRKLHFAAPTVAYVIGCNVGCICAPFKSNDEFQPTSAIHAGFVAFLAPNKCQSICFWRYAPKGAGADQCIRFWENALGKGMPIGRALTEAKWTGYMAWKDKQTETTRGADMDNSIEIDAPSMVLFGDPALRLK